MTDAEYRLQLMTYGPFTIPKKDSWVIVGSGPSADWFLKSVPDSSRGVIALSSTIEVIEKADINIHSHWESVFTAFDKFDRADIVYIPNPIHVGYRCVPMDAMNLLNHSDVIKYFNGKIRFFTKQTDLYKSQMIQESLYAKHTVATAALDLLARNGVGTVLHCGIDGGEDAPRAEAFKDLDCYKAKYTTHPSYDRTKEDFEFAARRLGVNLVEFKDAVMEEVC